MMIPSSTPAVSHALCSILRYFCSVIRFGLSVCVTSIRLVLLGSISLISFGLSTISCTLVLPSPAYAGFSIVYSIVTPSCSARRLINTSMIFSIFTCTTSLNIYAPLIVRVSGIWYNLPINDERNDYLCRTT